MANNNYTDAWWLQTFLTTEPSQPSFSLTRIYYATNDNDNVTRYVDYDTTEASLKYLADEMTSLGTNGISAIVLGHGDSCGVNRLMIDALAPTLNLEVQFLRHHFDYAGFEDEKGCPEAIKEKLQEEEEMQRTDWELKGRVDFEETAVGECASGVSFQGCGGLCVGLFDGEIGYGCCQSCVGS